MIYPDVVHSESARPSWQNALFDLAFLLYGSLLLIPFRWLKQAFLFPFALLVFALGILWAAYVGLTGLVGLVQGRKSWLILPVSVIFMMLTLLAPAALIGRQSDSVK